MKVRVIKTPKMEFGGRNIYDPIRPGRGQVAPFASILGNFSQGVAKMFGDVSYVSGVPKITPYEYRPLNKTKNWNPENTKPKDINTLGTYNDYYGKGNIDDQLKSYDKIKNDDKYNWNQYEQDFHNNRAVYGYQKGGPTSANNEEGQLKAVDPQLLQAYRTIGAALGGGKDPNELVQQIVDEGLSIEDAKEVVNKVMDMINPTSPTNLPIAQMGMNNGMFAGQSMDNIIQKPLMKDGGQTFVTSQPAYTQKSHNYFGTSNAPARDSYTDNEKITTSVKAVPREDATIEAEKGEYIFSKQGLYKIEGKKHYEGGTPLAAKGGEFIYSAHRDMSLDPKLQKEAGLKVSSSKALADHTPAKVLERNVDVKEYNRLKAILDNPKSDAVTKKTVQFMLDKMDNKLQVISKLQEAKKQPAPTEVQDQYLEQSETQQEINEQKQYAYGGDTGLPMYQNEPKVEWIKDKDGNIKKVTRTTVAGLDPSSAKTSPYTGTPEEQAAQRREAVHKWWQAMKEQNYKGPDPSADPSLYNPSKFNVRYPAIGDLQTFTAQTYPDFTREYLYSANPSAAVKAFLAKKGAKTLQEANPTNEEIAQLFRDEMFNWRLPITFSNEKVEEIPWEIPGTMTYDKVEGKKPRRGYVSRIDIPDVNPQIENLQRQQLATNLLSNQPFYVYTPENVQPWTVAPRQSTQPLENQAGQSRRIASRIGSRLQDAGAMQEALAKENDAVNDAFYKVGQYNAEKEAENYNTNLLRNAAAANQFAKEKESTFEKNAATQNQVNFANAAYMNQYSTARQKNLQNWGNTMQDILTAQLPYVNTYDEQGPDGTITTYYDVPFNPVTRKFNPQISLWNTRGVATKMAGMKTQADFRNDYNEWKKSDPSLTFETYMKYMNKTPNTIE